MSTAAIRFGLTALNGDPLYGPIRVSFQPAANTAGSPMKVAFDKPGVTDFTVTALNPIPYIVRIESANYHPYAFLANLQPGVVTNGGDFRLAIHPSRVKGVIARPLDPALQTILPSSGYFDSQTPIHQACLLNIFAKARHTSTAGCFGFLRTLLEIKQDRIFCQVTPDVEAFLTSSQCFQPAPNKLHQRPGHQLGNSFKSKDAHANIQLTLLREMASGQLCADIDIDESTGFHHGLEVLRNHLTRGKTNPYQVHQILMLAEIEPAYELLLR